MSRSIKKGPYVNIKLLRKIEKLNSNKTKKLLTTWSRATTIIPSMIGHTIAVYNGKIHVPIFISDQIVGHKLGEFSSTRTFKSHIKGDRKIRK